MGGKINSYGLADKHGMLDRSEIDLLKACVKELPKKAIIINIGASIGTSVCAMLEEKPEAFIYSIDRRQCIEEQRNLIECGLPADRVVRVLGDSAKVGLHWAFKVHLTFVDGNHSDEAVLKDIEIYKPLTKKIMLLHDYKHPNIPSMPAIVDKAMGDWEKIGEARYLVAFRRGK